MLRARDRLSAASDLPSFTSEGPGRTTAKLAERGSGSGAVAARESGRFGGSDLNIRLKRERGPKAA
mgnify:CR=1 FL=1